MNLEIYDDVFTDEKNNYLYHDILNCGRFSYGERDSNFFPATGLIVDFNASSIFYDTVVYFKPELKKLDLIRSYVNLFLPGELPYFHEDGKGITTCLFYLNPSYDLNEGGETQFFINNKIIGVQSKPKRMVVFDGTILHRATSFRTHPRITVALKFKNISLV